MPSIPSNISLHRLATLGASDPAIAHEIFTLLLKDLTQPGRPKLMLCIDNLAHAMQLSKYRDADYHPIHAHQLELVKWFMTHLSGEQKLPNGGMVLAAMSHSNSPHVFSLDTCLELLEEDGNLDARPAYGKWDERVLNVLGGKEGLQIQRMGGVSKDEVRGLMEYWARSGILMDRVDESAVSEGWVISGGGLVGELERGCVRGRMGYKV